MRGTSKGFVFLAVMLSAAVVLVRWALPPVVAAVLKASIERSVPASSCTVGRIAFVPSGLEAHDVSVSGAGYRVSLKRGRVTFGLRSFLNRRLKDVSLSGLSLAIESPGNNLDNILPKSRGNPPAWGCDRFEADGLVLNIDTRDVKADASGSVEVSFTEPLRARGAVTFGRIVEEDITFSGITLSSPGGAVTGKIAQIAYKDLKVHDAVVSVSDMFPTVKAQIKSATICNGTVTGDLVYGLEGERRYRLSLRAQGLDIAEFAKEMKLDEKVGITGLMNGTVAVAGAGEEVGDMEGRFDVTSAGGTLVVRDETMLQAMAEKAHQPVELFRDNFRDYAFDEGSITLARQGPDVISSIMVTGAKGKRTIDVVLHDIFKK